MNNRGTGGTSFHPDGEKVPFSRMSCVRRTSAALVVAAFAFLASIAQADVPAVSAAPATLGVRGSMHIDFGSRLQPEGTDTYDVDLICADVLRVKGKIVRQPRELSAFLGREKKPQELHYHLVFSVINPANRSENSDRVWPAWRPSHRERWATCLRPRSRNDP